MRVCFACKARPVLTRARFDIVLLGENYATTGRLAIFVRYPPAYFDVGGGGCWGDDDDRGGGCCGGVGGGKTISSGLCIVIFREIKMCSKIFLIDMFKGVSYNKQ